MALTDKKYEKFYKTTGTGDDKVEAKNLLIAEELWDADRAIGMRDHIVSPELAPIVFQLQQMQDELDYLRTEISANKDKATFPGLGTSSTTALAGDTTTISKAQADAITANTAKTGITSGEQRDIAGNKTNIATNTTAINTKLTVIPNANAQANSIQDLRVGVEYNTKAGAYALLITYTETTPKATIRKTGSIQLK